VWRHFKLLISLAFYGPIALVSMALTTVGMVAAEGKLRESERTWSSPVAPNWAGSSPGGSSPEPPLNCTCARARPAPKKRELNARPAVQASA